MALNTTAPEVTKAKNINPNAPAVTEVDAIRRALRGKSKALSEATTKERHIERELKTARDRRRDWETILGYSYRREAELQETILGHWYKIYEEELAKQPIERRDWRRLTKRPVHPFIAWCKDVHQEVCDRHPEASVAELYVILHDIWYTIPVDEKILYMELYSRACRMYMQKVVREITYQALTTLPDIDETVKHQTMSLLGQYVALRKVQNKQSGTATFPVSGTSNSTTIAESSTASQPSIYGLSAIQASIESAELRPNFLETVSNDLDEPGTEKKSSSEETGNDA